MKLFKSILLSAVLASAATVSAKTEVMVFFDAEDFTSDRANDTIRDLANLCTEEGVRAQFAEYRKLPSGALAVHLINYDPARIIDGARVVLPTGKSATAEEPLGADLSVHVLSADGLLPPFAEYLLVVVK